MHRLRVTLFQSANIRNFSLDTAAVGVLLGYLARLSDGLRSVTQVNSPRMTNLRLILFS